MINSDSLVIVRQRDKETAAALRLSSGGSTTQCSEMPLAIQMSSDNNDVFDDDTGTETTVVDQPAEPVVVSGEVSWPLPSRRKSFKEPETL